MKNLIVLAALFSTTIFSSGKSFAAADPMATVSGTVVGFDETAVRVLNNGQVSLVPRKAAPKKLKNGDKISVRFDPDAFKSELNAKKNGM